MPLHQLDVVRPCGSTVTGDGDGLILWKLRKCYCIIFTALVELEHEYEATLVWASYLCSVVLQGGCDVDFHVLIVAIALRPALAVLFTTSAVVGRGRGVTLREGECAAGVIVGDFTWLQLEASTARLWEAVANGKVESILAGRYLLIGVEDGLNRIRLSLTPSEFLVSPYDLTGVDHRGTCSRSDKEGHDQRGRTGVCSQFDLQQKDVWYARLLIESGTESDYGLTNDFRTTNLTVSVEESDKVRGGTTCISDTELEVTTYRSCCGECSV